MYVHVCMYMDVCKCMYVNVCMYMYVCKCMYVHVYMYVHVLKRRKYCQISSTLTYQYYVEE
jgi:hypothetical protein